MMLVSSFAPRKFSSNAVQNFETKLPLFCQISSLMIESIAVGKRGSETKVNWLRSKWKTCEKWTSCFSAVWLDVLFLLCDHFWPLESIAIQFEAFLNRLWSERTCWSDQIPCSPGLFLCSLLALDSIMRLFMFPIYRHLLLALFLWFYIEFSRFWFTVAANEWIWWIWSFFWSHFISDDVKMWNVFDAFRSPFLRIKRRFDFFALVVELVVFIWLEVQLSDNFQFRCIFVRAVSFVVVSPSFVFFLLL